MALANLTTSEGYLEAAQEGLQAIEYCEAALRAVTGEQNIVNAVVKRLQDVVNYITQQENDILKNFNITPGPNAEQQLQDLFRKFYNDSGLVNFTGATLEKNFLEAYRINVKERYRDAQAYINNVLIPQIELEAVKSLRNNEEIREAVGASFNDILKDEYIQMDLGTGKVTRTRSTKAAGVDIGKKFEIKAIKILASDLTPKQLERINKIIAEKKRVGDYSFRTSTSGNSLAVTIESKWFDYTNNGAKRSDIQKALDNGQLTGTDVSNINRSMIHLVASSVDSKYSDTIIHYMQLMLAKDPLMFFVGGNEKKITGVLNEIGAVMSISELLPNLNKNLIVDWVANKQFNKRDLSIDLIIRDLCGIQVKGSSLPKEVPIINIDFAEGTAEHILGKLQSAYPLFDFEDLETVFESEAFNVPARLEGTRWKEVGLNDDYFNYGPWDIFKEAYTLMQQVISSTHHFLTAFAPDFLYMAGGPEFSSQLANLDAATQELYGGNYLYMVNGIPRLASSLLQNIITDINNLTYLQNQAANFSLSASLGSIMQGKQKVSYNYVSYMNSNQRILNRKVKLTSSYAFQNI